MVGVEFEREPLNHGVTISPEPKGLRALPPEGISQSEPDIRPEHGHVYRLEYPHFGLFPQFNEWLRTEGVELQEFLDLLFMIDLDRGLERARERRGPPLFRCLFLGRGVFLEGLRYFEKLKRQRLQLPVCRTLKGIEEASILTLEGARRAEEATDKLLRAIYPEPITERVVEEAWQTVLSLSQEEDLSSVLDRLSAREREPIVLLSLQEARPESMIWLVAGDKPRLIRDEREESAREIIMPPPKELVEEIIRAAEEMEVGMTRLAGLFFKLGHARVGGDLTIKTPRKIDNQLKLAIQVFNEGLLRMAGASFDQESGLPMTNPDSGVLSILMKGALKYLRREIGPRAGWPSKHPTPEIARKATSITVPPFWDLRNFLETSGYYLGGPGIRIENGEGDLYASFSWALRPESRLLRCLPWGLSQLMGRMIAWGEMRKNKTAFAGECFFNREWKKG